MLHCMPKCEYAQLYDERGDAFRVPVEGPFCWTEGRSFAAGANWVSTTRYRLFDSETAVTQSTGRDVLELCPGKGFLITGVLRWINRALELPTEDIRHARTEIYYGSTNTEPVEQFSSVCDEWCDKCQIDANGVTGALVAGETFAVTGFPASDLVCAFRRPFLVTGDDRSRLFYEIIPSTTVTLRTNLNMFVTFVGYLIGGDCGPYRGEPGVKKDLSCEQVTSAPDGSVRNQFVA